MAAVRCALIPRDGLFFKDGRGWFASASGRGHAIRWPFPSSVLGAIRTAWGRMVESEAGQPFTPEQWRERTAAISLGAMVALRRRRGEPWSPSHRMWPVPADALYSESTRLVQPLDPIPRNKVRTLGRDDDAARESLWRPDIPAGKPAERPRFWTEQELSAWLAGQPVHALSAEDRDARSLPDRLEVRIRIDPETATAADGALFATETLETLQRTEDGLFEWALGVEASLPDSALDLEAPFTLGSDRRLATAETLSDGMFSPPTGTHLRDASGLRVIVATPAIFSAGWRPDGFEVQGQEYRGRLNGVDADLVLRAAFVPRPEHVSGWDMVSNRPKKTLRLVPAGAVYFFEKADGAPFTAGEMNGLWLRPLGQHQNEGFGRIVAGPWEVHRS